jgi:tetratricopeptide (TPR) repeat protein
LITTGTQINSQTIIETDIILLQKLLETYLFKIYIKDMDHIVKSLKILNVSDFIMENLFLYAEVYDHTKHSIKKFREKVNWNFCEISVNLYNDIFPKFVKKTIYRHLNFVPNDDSFLYYAVQYYYTNKDYQKANLLINKIITKEDKTELVKDTQSICYLMLANIKINKESYGEALDLAICNLERIKEIKSTRKVFNDEILWRTYFVLGFCYSKLGDNTINFQEKNKYSHLALASFKMALEGDVINPIFIFFYARQLYELKNFSSRRNFV